MPTTNEKNITALQVSTDDGYAVGHVGSTAKRFDTRDFKRGRRAVSAISSTAYSLATADEGRFIVHTSASNSSVTIPSDASLAWPVGGQVEIMRNGAGTLTIQAGAGVTLSAAGQPKARAQGSVVYLRKIAANTWVLSGDTSA